MHNPVKGEVGFMVDDERYVLVFSINALCALEDALDMSVSDIGARMTAGMRMSFLRTVFWAGLIDRRPDLTEREAGDILTAVGAAEAGSLIAQAFTAAFPKAEAATGAARPRSAPAKKPAAGAGPISSPSGAN